MSIKTFNKEDEDFIVKFGVMKQIEILDQVVKAERKNDLKFSDYIICLECGTIAYGDGNCHCSKNRWIVWEEELNKQDVKRDNGD